MKILKTMPGGVALSCLLLPLLTLNAHSEVIHCTDVDVTFSPGVDGVLVADYDRACRHIVISGPSGGAIVEIDASAPRVLEGADFTAANLQGTTINATGDRALEEANFTGVDMTNSTINATGYESLNDAIFDGANLSGSTLVAGADESFRGASFVGADLTGVLFSGDSLYDYAFRNAIFDDADFSGADLSALSHESFDYTSHAYYSADTNFGTLVESDHINDGWTLLTSEVPIPAAAWLFGSALLGLGAMQRKKT